jgi:hypothetical protein
MATLDELHSALVKADAAGDAEGAKALADHIRSISAVPSQVATENASAGSGSEAKPDSLYSKAARLAKMANPVTAILSFATDKDARQNAGNIGAGLVRGAGSTGATAMRVLPNVLGGDTAQENAERRKAMDGGLRELGADPDSLLYKGGKLGGEVMGTAGAGGLIANGARAVGAAPALVDAIASGGFAGGGSALTRAVGGAINGGATAALVNPKDAGIGAAIGGVLPGATQVAGMAGNALSNAASAGSKRLMQSAIKPTIAQLKTGDAETAVNTLLQYGISPTKSGVNKLNDLIDGLNSRIGDSIKSSTATVSKQKVLDALGDVRNKFGNQVSPTGDLNAIRGVADDFAAHPNLPLGDAIPVQQAQEMKQGTYKVLSKKYGQIGSAETEAQKGLARGLKEEVASAVPGVQALNAEESKLITTLNVAERRALMELNKNPVGLTALAHNPIAAMGFLADRSAAFKAIAARMIHAATPAAGTTSQKLVGLASNPLLRTTGLVATEANP